MGVRLLRCIGGPFDGRTLQTDADVMQITGHPDMEYVSTRPTDTNWRETYDRDWFIHGLDEAPPVPDKVFEWPGDDPG